VLHTRCEHAFESPTIDSHTGLLPVNVHFLNPRLTCYKRLGQTLRVMHQWKATAVCTLLHNKLEIFFIKETCLVFLERFSYLCEAVS